MWGWFKDLIFMGVQFLEGFLGDWGLAIIGITLIFRIALIPLINKSTRSAAEMQKIQPKMQELQTKYKDNPEKLQEEMAKFYKENKVNPLGGCLLPLLQMPIFIALYQVLQKLPQLINGMEVIPYPLSQVLVDVPAYFQHTAISFLNIIPDLSVSMQTLYKVSLADGGVFAHWTQLLPYAILVILGGVGTVLPQFLQKSNNSATAGSMKSMSVVMGAMMLYIGFISPAGVLLYWITSSVFGAVQQVIVQNRVYKEDDEDGSAITVEPVSVKQKAKKPSKKS